MMRDRHDGPIGAFGAELATTLPSIEAALETAQADPADAYPLREAYRLLHALKGAASMVGLAALGYLLNQAEDLIDPESGTVDPVAVGLLRETLPQFAAYVDAGLTGAPVAPVASPLSAFRIVCAGASGALAELVEIDTREFAAWLADGAVPSEAPADETALEPIPDLCAFTAPPSASELAVPIQKPVEPAPPLTTPAAPAAVPDDMDAPEAVDPELAEVFAQEAQEHLQAIARLTSELSPEATDRQSLQELRRAVHTLKGAAGVVGFTTAARLAHRMEDLLDALYDDGVALTAEAVRVLTASSDALDELLTPTAAQPRPDLVPRLLAQFDALGPAAAAAAAPPVAVAEAAPAPAAPVVAAIETPETVRPRPAFNERRRGEERRSSEGRREQDQVVRVPLARINELVRFMTELVINRATFEQHYAGLASQVDELKLSTARLRRVAQKLETDYEARALGGNLVLRTTGGETGRASGGGGEGFDELEFDRYTDFHLLTRELAETASDIATVGSRVGDALGDFDSDLTRLGRITRDIQDKVMEFRMVPLRTLGSRLERAVRVAAEACGKSVAFALEGEQVAMDKSLLQEMADPLMHLLRNAVDHGIERPEAREAAGKSPTGRVVVRAYHEGTDVVLEVEDDGRGLDFDRIRRTVVERGYMDEAAAAALDEESLAGYLFEPGFSTAQRVTEISGRGVGMDIVKAKVVHVNGRIRVVSRRGAGATWVVRLPMTLAITRILLFRAGNQLMGLPLGAILQIVRPHAAAIVPMGSDHVITVGGRTYPVRDLADWLGLPRQARPAHGARPLLIANLAGRHVAIEIDEILTSRDAVVKTLGTHLRRVPGVWGATLLGDGTVVLLLNPADLGGVAEAPRPRPASPRAALPEKEPYTILIVDDSLSMRHVLSAAVRRAGWTAVQARDGFEALEAVHRGSRPPDLILLDIEMPRMDGYEFLATIRGQKGYATLPIVMLTSRGGEKHREKAGALGATDYLVKPFQEDALTERVERLIQTSRQASRKAAS